MKAIRTNLQEEEKKPSRINRRVLDVGDGVHPRDCGRQMAGLEVTVWSCLRTGVASERKAGKSMVINSEAAFLKALG